nr:sigma-70 family RNA polymerase sigma factor [Sphingomicrobium lutaoense]
MVRKVAAGEREAFDRLVLPLVPRLLGIARRMLGSTSQAEDAVQNALAAVWRTRQRLEPDRPVLPYLTTVTLNKCRDQLRRRKAARLFGLGQDAADERDEAPDPEMRVGDTMALSQVQSEIDRLPTRLKEALVLIAIEGMSHRQAAALTGTTPKTIEMRLYRARKRLRHAIDFFEG